MSFFYKHIKLLFLFLISSGVSATEANYSVGMTISSYDNLNLVQDPVEGEVSESIIGTASVSENTANLVANIEASLEVINYKNNNDADESLGNLIANALWVISPGRYEWYISDRYTQALTNSFGSNTPDNRTNTNAFATGPNFIFRINSRNNLNLEARVETISFESAQAVADTDNDRVDIATSWEYRFQAESSLSLNYSVETVDYDDEVNNTNFDRRDVFVVLNYQRGLNAFEAGIGVIHVDNENTADVDETGFRLSVVNTRTRTSSVQLEISRNITDTSTELLDYVPDPLIDSDSEFVASDIFLDETARIIYNKTLMSGDFSINLNKTTNDYQQQDQL